MGRRYYSELPALDAFADWVVAKRNVGDVTAITYKRQVRWMLATLVDLRSPDVTEEALHNVLATLPAGNRSPHQTSWNAFAEYMAEVGTPLPIMRPRKRGAPVTPIVYDAPEAVKAAVRILVQDGMPPAIIARAVWPGKLMRLPAMHRPGKEAEATAPCAGINVNDRHGGVTYRISDAIIDTLTDWARGDAECPVVGAPFVPSTPGGTEAMPVAVLNAWTHR